MVLRVPNSNAEVVIPMVPEIIDPSGDYFVLVRRTPQTWQWTYEIHRRSKPLGVSLYHHGFPSEAAAKLAGERLLRRLLDDLRDMSLDDLTADKRPPAGSIGRGSPIRALQGRTA